MKKIFSKAKKCIKRKIQCFDLHGIYVTRKTGFLLRFYIVLMKIYKKFCYKILLIEIKLVLLTFLFENLFLMTEGRDSNMSSSFFHYLNPKYLS